MMNPIRRVLCVAAAVSSICCENVYVAADGKTDDRKAAPKNHKTHVTRATAVPSPAKPAATPTAAAQRIAATKENRNDSTKALSREVVSISNGKRANRKAHRKHTKKRGTKARRKHKRGRKYRKHRRRGRKTRRHTKKAESSPAAENDDRRDDVENDDRRDDAENDDRRDDVESDDRRDDVEEDAAQPAAKAGETKKMNSTKSDVQVSGGQTSESEKQMQPQKGKKGGVPKNSEKSGGKKDSHKQRNGQKQKNEQKRDQKVTKSDAPVSVNGAKSEKNEKTESGKNPGKSGEDSEKPQTAQEGKRKGDRGFLTWVILALVGAVLFILVGAWFLRKGILAKKK